MISLKLEKRSITKESLKLLSHSAYITINSSVTTGKLLKHVWNVYIGIFNVKEMILRLCSRKTSPLASFSIPEKKLEEKE